MEVILADVLGYCMGVKRAVESALNALEKYKNKKVYSLGPLIHNKIALDNLEKKGLLIIEENDISDLKDESVVIIRAHGVPPKVLVALQEKNCIIINATCPRVLASQKNAENFSKKDYIIILAGDKNHGEVAGIAGYSGKDFVLIQNVKEAFDFVKKSVDFNKNVLLLSQTTFSPIEYKKITDIITDSFKNVKVMNTICPATEERQNALFDLCPKVEGIIVAGGKNSANTKRLFMIAKENCKKACLIENADEIPDDFFELKKVGLTAGASTPNEVIKSVYEKLNSRALRAASERR